MLNYQRVYIYIDFAGDDLPIYQSITSKYVWDNHLHKHIYIYNIYDVVGLSHLYPINEIPFKIQPISFFCASKFPINLFFSLSFSRYQSHRKNESRFDLTDISFFELDRLFARSAKTLKRRQQKRRRKEKRRNDGNEESSSSETWEKTQRVSLW